MENQTQSQKDKTIRFLSTSIIIASVIIGGSILYSNFKSSDEKNNIVVNDKSANTQSAGAVQPSDISKVDIAGEPFIGDANANIIMAYWFDFQCPFCKRLETDVFPTIINEYVKTGKVKIVFKDFQNLGADSQTAGIAAKAVWEIAPNKYFAWHTAMYNKQDDENKGWGSKADILALTKSLDIDSIKVSQLMESKKAEYQKKMDDDKAEGKTFGTEGTPAVIIGKQMIFGAQPLSTFKIIIDEMLR